MQRGAEEAYVCMSQADTGTSGQAGEMAQKEETAHSGGHTTVILTVEEAEAEGSQIFEPILGNFIRLCLKILKQYK